MKARSLARRPAAARRPARAPLAKAARPLRSAHERQAEDVGARFMGGETGLGRHLTPAPAACFHLPASSPQALSAGLRGPFERSFNADLGGLRVHTDAPAAGAARLLGARAFTAGSSIYFGPGAWSPHSRTGRELLAHEIAHALQQAGRASLQGRQRLEPMAQGVAGVQRQPDPDEKARAARHKANAIAASFKAGELWQPSKDSKGCTETIDRHLKALPDDALMR
jgi:hypothetical protein